MRLTEPGTVAAVAFSVNVPAFGPNTLTLMKLRHVLSAFLTTFGLGLTTFAGSSITSVIAVPFQAQRATAIALVQPADYVCATVSVSSREKDPTRQADDVRAALKLLEVAAAKSPFLQLHDGPLRFNAGPRTREASFGPFSSTGPGYNSSPLLTSSVRILYKLDGSGSDPFTATAALRKFVDELKVPNLTDLHINNVTLAVESPERQRERLLSLIRESAAAMKKTFNAEQVTIGGLDGPVLVRQVDEATVELFIDFQLSVTAK